MAHTLTIDPGGSNEKTYSVDDFLVGGNFTKDHSAVSDFEIEVPHDLSLEDNKTDEIHLEDGNDFLFRGYLHVIQNRERAHLCTLAGEGVEYDLTRDSATFTSSNELAHNAIDRFWKNETNFTPTVTTPTANQTTSSNQQQEADTNSEFSDITTIASDDPVAVQNTNFELLQSAFPIEAENFDNSSSDLTFAGVDEWSNGDGARFTTDGDFLEWNFTLDYTLPADNVKMKIRSAEDNSNNSNNTVGVKYTIDGSEVFTTVDNGGPLTTVQWRDENDGALGAGADGYQGGDLAAGTHTIRAECVSDAGDEWLDDILVVYDDRFNHASGGSDNTFDNTVHQNQGFLDDPQLFPFSFEFTLDRVNTSWNITDGSISSSWDDTSNDQRIQLRLYDNTTWHPNDGTEDNTSSITTDFGSDVGSIIQGRVRFSRYPTGSNAQSSTPRFGYNGQKLQSWEITIDGNDIPVFDDATFEGNDLEIAQEMHDRANMRFWVPHEKNAKNVKSARAGDVTDTLPNNATSDSKVEDRKRTVDFRGYANKVTLRGNVDSNGNRITATVSDSGEISSFGTHQADIKNPNLKNAADVKMQARRALGKLISEREISGVVECPTVTVTPGPSYTNLTWKDGSTDTAALEEHSYTFAEGELRSRLKFEIEPTELATTITGLQNSSRENALGF